MTICRAQQAMPDSVTSTGAQHVPLALTQLVPIQPTAHNDLSGLAISFSVCSTGHLMH